MNLLPALRVEPGVCRTPRPVPSLRGRTLCLVAALGLWASPAFAQTDAAVSLGLALSVKSPTTRAADADVGPAVVLRLKGDAGLGPSIGFSWFSTRVMTSVDGREVPLGRLDIKPVMVGLSYGWQLARFRPEVSLEGGLTFTRVRGTGALQEAYGRSGVTNVGVSVSNPFAWRALLTGWYDIGSRYALTASVGYLGVSPTITTTSSAGVRRERIGLGSLVTSVGFAYRVF
jgi:hypothetical protein